MPRRLTRLTVALLTTLLAGTVVGVPAAQAATSIDADIVTVDPHINKELTIQGTVTEPPPLAMVSVTRTDAAGPHPLDPVAVDDAGAFTVTDTPPVRGTATYHLALMSDSTVSVDLSVYVTGIATTVSAATPDHVVRTGRTVTLTGRISGGPPGAVMYLVATPYKRDRELIKAAPSGSDGTLSGSYTVTRRTMFRAAFRGNQTYEPSYDLVLVKARADVTNRLGGGYATRNGYRLYGAHAEPPLYGHLRPERRDACLYYKAQRRYLGEWHTVEASGCVRTDGDGRTVRVLEGSHVLDTPYRVRVEWHGSIAWLRDNGPWLKLMFRSR
jgi:hypothetical protein